MLNDMVATCISLFPMLGLSLLVRVVLEGLGALVVVVAACGIAVALLLRSYLKIIEDLFLNRSQIPGVPDTGVQLSGEPVELETADHVRLRGIFLPSANSGGRTIIFCHEYGSDKSSVARYQRFLVPAGFNVFAFDFRGHGQSGNLNGYEPKQWLTTHEVADLEAVIRYVEGRPDVNSSKIGLLGLSRGACACISVAGGCDGVKAIVAEGTFATQQILVEYIKRWISVYAVLTPVHPWLPECFFQWLSRVSLRRAEETMSCRFVAIDGPLAGLAPRALYMIHGKRDSYVSVEHATRLYDVAGQPKDLWVVPSAKHNEGARVAPEEYAQRVTAFFQRHLN